MTPADPLTLARAVIARGHIGTEAHELARALIVAELWRQYWRALTQYEWACACNGADNAECLALERGINDRRRALRKEGEQV